MTSPSDELAYEASQLSPLKPEGRALAYIIVTVLCVVPSWILVGLRTWCRAIWLSNVWGLDDTLAVLGLVAYTINSTYAILMALYGFGVPDDHIPQLAAYSFRSLQYNVWWEVTYLVSAAFIKTSVGVAVIRIALERRYRYTIYAFVAIANIACIGGVLWELCACRPIQTRWNPLVGSCEVPGLVYIAYAIAGLTVATDAAFAVVPIFILRRMTMAPRIKRGLMLVLTLGSAAAIASVIRYPFIMYFTSEHNFLYDNVWIPFFSQIELAIGLTAGSLPGIAKMFHFFDPPNKPLSHRGEEGWAARHSIGGTPLEDLADLGAAEMAHESRHSRICVSEHSSSRRPGGPKLSMLSLKGVWKIKSVT